MQVRYQHTFTVVVEGTDNFDEEASLAKTIEYGDRDARCLQLLVKRGGTTPKPVFAARKTKTIIIHEGE